MKYVDVGPGCWIWNGSSGGSGYGQFYDGERLDGAHRFSYRIFVGDISDGMCVLHRCDVRKCVNPSHLWSGTHQENTLDAYGKDRLAHGEKSHLAKLNNVQISNIRQLYREGICTQRRLSDLFGVSQCHIGRIVRCATRSREGVA